MELDERIVGFAARCAPATLSSILPPPIPRVLQQR